MKQEDVKKEPAEDGAEMCDMLAKAWITPHERPSRSNKLPPTSTLTSQGSADMN